MTVFFFSAPLFFLAANAVQIAWGPFPPAAFSVCIAALFLALAALTAALAVRTARGKTARVQGALGLAALGICTCLAGAEALIGALYFLL